MTVGLSIGILAGFHWKLPVSKNKMPQNQSWGPKIRFQNPCYSVFNTTHGLLNDHQQDRHPRTHRQRQGADGPGRAFVSGPAGYL